MFFSLFGNDDMDITEFGLTNKSDFYRCSYGECFRFIADKYMYRCAKPIPDTERITALSIILRHPPDFKKPVTDLGI
ncbi:MAG: hypothetical protein QN721_10630 [Nitrososphaeraceae archaeon]|nr:hypothetical protein [Nitrososphaeraceae archaeon]